MPMALWLLRPEPLPLGSLGSSVRWRRPPLPSGDAPVHPVASFPRHNVVPPILDAAWQRTVRSWPQAAGSSSTPAHVTQQAGPSQILSIGSLARSDPVN
ncbi:hypothetical protein BDA96_06G034400 [Sorghum bicolor]|uniref:Uncharacterized protein n=1 Tax=Sorghum bicolor TaxID=4558 RepID=A0A921UBY4_SORBI|nr:hypothetical protein BDA96_06G034400 [Sorghum bicolor]